ncbi:hypothetical protein [Vibrio sp. SCSIO 43136]|uniref:hypothetical protein n=1 Tax=Vibrio sp. SCSIO 43136 TaxID=2819101 RepID=UPI0020754A59|nr:hypothetical protein [Vibrio sp. SCSIO 43136]USD67203.1 hypothetical protein J4N39_21450 [Vibrio sp. SCSIO 43136]
MMKSKLLLGLACISASSGFANEPAPLVVEAWLEPAVDVEMHDGSWNIYAASDLPKPPLTVLDRQGSKVLLNIKGLGVVWVQLSSVRLSEESLRLLCQDNQTARSSDYQNFGMRGDDEVVFSCVSERK